MNSITLAILVEARREDLLREAERERLLKHGVPWANAIATARQSARRLGQVAAGRTLQWQHLVR
jgi:hypothetical protein